MIKNILRINYTYQHRHAMMFLLEHYKDEIDKLTYTDIRISYEALRRRLLMHDVDKMFMYLFWNIRTTSHFHYQYAPHHNWGKYKNPSGLDIVESILDHESAGLTKPDKPLNAYESYHMNESIYKQQQGMRFMNALGMCEKYNVNERYPDFKLESLSRKELYQEYLKEIEAFLENQFSLQTVNHRGVQYVYETYDDQIRTVDGKFICTKNDLQKKLDELNR